MKKKFLQILRLTTLIFPLSSIITEHAAAEKIACASCWWSPDCGIAKDVVYNSCPTGAPYASYGVLWTNDHDCGDNPQVSLSDLKPGALNNPNCELHN